MVIKHLQSGFLALTIGIAVSYIGIATYDHILEARQLQISMFITDPQMGYDNEPTQCPKLERVPGPEGSFIIKDACTNLYWFHMDLPLLDTDGKLSGYTWSEAGTYCANLAKTTDGKALLRLPTSDELMSLLTLPCPQVDSFTQNTNDGCSFVVKQGAQAVQQEDGVSGSILPSITTQQYFYTQTYNGRTIRFADGIYWTADEISIDGENRDAATSVNMFRGEVSNPLMDKDIRLNVRCIYDKPTSAKIAQEQSREFGNIYDRVEVLNNLVYNEVQWWQGSNGTYSMGYRKNWTPRNGDVNNCPEGLNTRVSGDLNLCTGVTAQTMNPVIFSCDSKSYRKGPNNTIVCQ